MKEGKHKIKVMHFVSGLVSGGVEEMLYNYCKFMDHDKYEFIIVYQHEPVMTCKEKLESIGCKTVRITARNENFFKNIKDSIMIIKSERPDIVHAHMNLMNFCALWAAKKNNIPIRISHSHIAEKNNGKVFKIVAGFCKVLCVRYATELFTCGEEAGEYLYGKKRMKSDAIKIVENAVDLDYFAVDKVLRDKFRERFDLTDKFVVGHVGRFSFQKNHERLLDIFRELLKYKEKAVLLLVGTGELENSIRKKVEELELTDKVIFYGTTKDMKEVYSALDVFVLPSRFEGFPVVSVEIQAANIPAVFSNTIATTCKITDSINFMDLEQSDETWAKAIISAYSDFKPCDLTVLREKYDIRSKARKLDNYYDNLLELRG